MCIGGDKKLHYSSNVERIELKLINHNAPYLYPVLEV